MKPGSHSGKKPECDSIRIADSDTIKKTDRDSAREPDNDNQGIDLLQALQISGGIIAALALLYLILHHVFHII